MHLQMNGTNKQRHMDNGLVVIPEGRWEGEVDGGENLNHSFS